LSRGGKKEKKDLLEGGEKSAGQESPSSRLKPANEGKAISQGRVYLEKKKRTSYFSGGKSPSGAKKKMSSANSAGRFRSWGHLGSKKKRVICRRPESAAHLEKERLPQTLALLITVELGRISPKPMCLWGGSTEQRPERRCYLPRTNIAYDGTPPIFSGGGGNVSPREIAENPDQLEKGKRNPGKNSEFLGELRARKTGAWVVLLLSAPPSHEAGKLRNSSKEKGSSRAQTQNQDKEIHIE